MTFEWDFDFIMILFLLQWNDDVIRDVFISEAFVIMTKDLPLRTTV